MTRGKKIGFWVLSAVLALMFLGSGGAKLAGAEEMVQNFARWGFPGWFIVVVGISEVAAAIGLLIPRMRFLAGGALMVIMIGAVGTHVMAGEFGQLVVPAVLAVLSGVIAWAHRPAAQAQVAAAAA